jgi:hypothetical protein
MMVGAKMARKQIPIFATESDIALIAGEVSRTQPLRFAVAGSVDQATVAVLDDLEHPEPFVTYLAGKEGIQFSVRTVPQRDGGNKYTVDQLENPGAVMIRCGGMLNDERLVAGQIGTATDEKESEEIFALFSKAIRSEFEKIRSYYVGPGAARLLDNGLRLTPSARSPETYDLARKIAS